MRVPREYELCEPTLQALRTLGGIGSNQAVAEVVIAQLRLPEELVREPHGNTNRTELEYRLAWARTVLKTCGFLDNPEQGIWKLTKKAHGHPSIDSVDIRKEYLDQKSMLGSAVDPSPSDYEYQSDSEEDELWNRMVAAQFFAGYAESDALYDKI